LRHFPQPASIAALKEFENDKDIRGKVADSLEWIKDPVKAKLEKEEFMDSIKKIWIDVNKKYEG